MEALSTPLDYPPLDAAIVPGDRVAIAIDPNVPQITEIVRGILKAVGGTDAGAIEFVLWDEANDETLQAVSDEVGDAAEVFRHCPSSRESLRYLAADESAAPVYVNRRLVDADFVLPVMSARPDDQRDSQDLAGVYPALADSSTRGRYSDAAADQEQHPESPPDIPWLLGVHLLLSVRSNDDGNAADIKAGTLTAIGDEIKTLNQQSSESGHASIVVASLDGDEQQQSWCNLARAVSAAAKAVEEGGTIVVWSDLSQPPQGALQRLAEVDSLQPAPFEPTEDDEFPPWDQELAIAKSIAKIASDHRLLIHSRLQRESLEALGLGVIETEDELQRLCESFESCAVVRAAQHAGGTNLIG